MAKTLKTDVDLVFRKRYFDSRCPCSLTHYATGARSRMDADGAHIVAACPAFTRPAIAAVTARVAQLVESPRIRRKLAYRAGWETKVQALPRDSYNTRPAIAAAPSLKSSQRQQRATLLGPRAADLKKGRRGLVAALRSDPRGAAAGRGSALVRAREPAAAPPSIGPHAADVVLGGRCPGFVAALRSDQQKDIGHGKRYAARERTTGGFFGRRPNALLLAL